MKKYVELSKVIDMLDAKLEVYQECKKRAKEEKRPAAFAQYDTMAATTLHLMFAIEELAKEETAMTKTNKYEDLEYFINNLDGAIFNGIDDFCNELPDYHEQSRLANATYNAQYAIDELRELLKEMFVEVGEKL